MFRYLWRGCLTTVTFWGTLGALGVVLSMRACAPVPVSEGGAMAPQARLDPRQEALQTSLRRGIQEFMAEIQRGGFIALTGVEPREKISLLEGSTFTKTETGTTFVLANGVTVPPLSEAAYQQIRQALPPGQQSVLDPKFFWLLQRNPALPLIAAGLERGDYLPLLTRGWFDTDAYYQQIFFPALLAAAAQADVDLAVVRPLLEIHLVTLGDAFFRRLEMEPEGTVHSFYEQELALTNKQYLLRALLATPAAGLARLKAIEQVEAAQVKANYTESPTTSTTIVLGRLPLPTPTAAEDTPGAHALSIAHLVDRGISLFPAPVEEAAVQYQQQFHQQRHRERQYLQQLRDLARSHGPALLKAIDHYQDESFFTAMGITPALNRQSVRQMDTAHLLGIYATRHEGLTAGLSAAESYPLARADFLQFFRENSPGLKETNLLTLLFNDQALNPQLWPVLAQRLDLPRADMQALQNRQQQLLQGYQAMNQQEAAVFRALQAHHLDISTEALIRLSVAFTRRFSDLAQAQFRPANPQDPQYRRFLQGVMPFLRDMPDMNVHWYNSSLIKAYGQNYLVPDLMATTPEEAPVLSAMGQMHFNLVSENQLNLWDFPALAQVLNTSFNLTVGHPPSSLPPEQLAWLPLIDQYRGDIKRVAGADGLVGTNVLHGLALQDFRLANWPQNRFPLNLPLASQVHATLTGLLVAVALPPADTPPGNVAHAREPVAIVDEAITVQGDPIAVLMAKGSELSLSKRLVLQHRPTFTSGHDGTLDLHFDFEGHRLTLPAVSHHFNHLYSPAYMTRIALPRYGGAVHAAALNQVIQRSHGLYGGYTPPDMTLPEPLQGQK